MEKQTYKEELEAEVKELEAAQEKLYSEYKERRIATLTARLISMH